MVKRRLERKGGEKVPNTCEEERKTDSAVGFTGESRAKEQEKKKKERKRKMQARCGRSRLSKGGVKEGRERREKGDPNAHILQSATARERGRKSEEETTIKTPGEYRSASGASSKKFLPFSPGPWDPWEPFSGHKATTHGGVSFFADGTIYLTEKHSTEYLRPGFRDLARLSSRIESRRSAFIRDTHCVRSETAGKRHVL